MLQFLWVRSLGVTQLGLLPQDLTWGCAVGIGQGCGPIWRLARAGSWSERFRVAAGRGLSLERRTTRRSASVRESEDSAQEWNGSLFVASGLFYL